MRSLQRAPFAIRNLTRLLQSSFIIVTIGCSCMGLSSHAVAAMSSSAPPSTGKKTGAFIFLHGLGDTPEGWAQLESQLPVIRPRLANLEYIFPHAPTISITVNGGMAMPGWFDLYDWPINIGIIDDAQGQARAVRRIQAEVEKLGYAGIPPSKIVVGGFSQGGAIALLAAYQSKGFRTPVEPFAGCVGLSAWLTTPKEIQVSEAARNTPMFWGHGEMDDKVLYEQQAFGVNILRQQGVTVTDEQYDMGHSSHPEEIEAMAVFLDRVLFGDDADGGGDKAWDSGDAKTDL